MELAREKNAPFCQAIALYELPKCWLQIRSVFKVGAVRERRKIKHLPIFLLNLAYI
jgi:hypothetical protein